MGEWVQLKAADGHTLSAYKVSPEGEVRGGLVVVQEIFGVNKSIRAVADHYAQQGYVAIAPALFDRFERNVELGYEPDDVQRAMKEYLPKLTPQAALQDIAAAFAHVEGQGKGTAVLGFCYGGFLSWLSATRGAANGFTPACTVGFYPGGIGRVANEDPVCPVMLHFGGADSHIGSDQVEAVRSAHPDVTIYSYEGAEHAFANPDRTSFRPEAAQLAHKRSLEFLRRHVG